MRWAVPGMLGLCLGALAAEAPNPRMLFSFETRRGSRAGSRFEHACGAGGQTCDGGSTFPARDRGRRGNGELDLALRPRSMGIGAHGAVAVDAFNDEAAPVTLVFQVTDAAGAVTKGNFVLRAKGEASIALALNTLDPLDVGMRGPAAIPGYRLAASDYQRIDSSRVTSIAMSFRRRGQTGARFSR